MVGERERECVCVKVIILYICFVFEEDPKEGVEIHDQRLKVGRTEVFGEKMIRKQLARAFLSGKKRTTHTRRCQ